MISRVDLRHFKCFETLKLPLRPLTLLSGGNAAGKTSVMHALVLLHQTMREHEWSSRLMLNGATIRLGTVVDVIDQVHSRSSFEIELFDENADRFEWRFEGNRDELSMAIQQIRGDTKIHGDWKSTESDALRYLLPSIVSDHSLANRLSRLTYLTAERLGPREYYLYDDPQLTPVVGPKGEYAVSILHSGRDSQVLSGLVDTEAPPTRFHQVKAQMARFFPGCVLEIKQVERANVVTLAIRTSSDTDFLRPVNTGFGLTQVLPIFIAAFSAEKDDILLIENPEAHLHPAGQAAIGAFFGMVASAGVQVMLETHSDHVLNGIRRAVKTGLIASENVALHFFRQRDERQENETPQVQSPAIDSSGDIDSWPDGFFDQFDTDMNYFAGWS